MKIRIENGMPLVTARVVYGQQALEFQNVLLDTGSHGCIFPTDRLLEIGLKFNRTDEIYAIQGVGGEEFVFQRRVNQLWMGEFCLEDFRLISEQWTTTSTLTALSAWILCWA